MTWTPPPPLGNTTGYTIFYTDMSGKKSSETIGDGNADRHTLTGLTNGKTYMISIVAKSSTDLLDVHYMNGVPLGK